jgi:hypothetical protein
MSSVTKSFSQIPVQTKFLTCFKDISGAETAGAGAGADGYAAFTLDSGEFLNITSIATQTDVEAAAGFAVRGGGANVNQLTAGELFKDMGRQITVLAADDATHLALYRQVQLVSGATTEGVANDADYSANIYIRVWAADGQNVRVARLG